MTTKLSADFRPVQHLLKIEWGTVNDSAQTVMGIRYEHRQTDTRDTAQEDEF